MYVFACVCARIRIKLLARISFFREEIENIATILDVNLTCNFRRLSRPKGTAHSERPSSASTCNLLPGSSETGDSDDDTSSLALGSAPVYRPQPPRSAKGHESPVRTGVGQRLPPVQSASPLQTSPPLKDTQIDRSFHFFPFPILFVSLPMYCIRWLARMT